MFSVILQFVHAAICLPQWGHLQHLTQNPLKLNTCAVETVESSRALGFFAKQADNMNMTDDRVAPCKHRVQYADTMGGVQ